MAYQSFKDASGTTQYRKVTGAGTTGDPAACHQIIDSGAVDASQAGTWNITNVSGTISLPTGAATSANQTTIIGHVDGIETLLGTIDADTGSIATSATSIDGKITACNTGAVVLAAGTAAFGKLASNSGVTIGAVEIAATQTLSTVTTVGTVTTLTGGGIAHDSADSGNPVKVGAIATASLLGRTPVAGADRTDLVADTSGAVIVRSGTSLEDIISEVKTNTDGASTAMTSAFAATASQRIYLTDIIIANSSATAITVDIRDGSAGSVLATFPVPAGGGVVHSFATPLRFSSNTAAAFDGSAAATTLSVTMVGFKAKF